MARQRLGPGFARLWTAGAISNLGDGVALAALPLLAASLTGSPTTVAVVAAAGALPWLLFSLVGGAIADRTDRRRTMAVVDTFRFAAMGLLAVALAADVATIPLLVIVSFALGMAETVFDNASQAMLPSVVAEQHLELANGRLEGAQIVTNQFMGPPLGAWLFTVAAAAPFALDAASFLAAAVLVLLVRGSFRPARDLTGVTVRHDIAAGLRWLFAHRLLRTLAIALGILNFAAMATTAVLVLYARRVLGLSDTGYGFLITAEAAGAVVGSLVAARVSTRLGQGRALTAAVVAMGVALLIPGIWPQTIAVGFALAFGGAAALVWNILTVSLRQSLVPDVLLGRVNSAYRMIGWGTLPLGALAGGIVAEAFGLRAPYLIAGGAALIVAFWTTTTITSRSIERARRRARWTESAENIGPDNEPVVDLTILEAGPVPIVDLRDPDPEPAPPADADELLPRQRPSGAR